METKLQLKINKIIKSRFKDSILKKEQASLNEIPETVQPNLINGNTKMIKSRNQEKMGQKSTLKFNPDESLDLKVASNRFNIK